MTLMCTLCNCLSVTKVDINSYNQLAANCCWNWHQQLSSFGCCRLYKVQQACGRVTVSSVHCTSPYTALLQQQGTAVWCSSKFQDAIVWHCLIVHGCKLLAALQLQQVSELNSSWLLVQLSWGTDNVVWSKLGVSRLNSYCFVQYTSYKRPWAYWFSALCWLCVSVVQWTQNSTVGESAFQACQQRV